jgi:hypothetical protein
MYDYLNRQANIVPEKIITAAPVIRRAERDYMLDKKYCFLCTTIRKIVSSERYKFTVTTAGTINEYFAKV